MNANTLEAFIQLSQSVQNIAARAFPAGHSELVEIQKHGAELEFRLRRERDAAKPVVWPKWEGQKLTLRYTDAADLSVLRNLPGGSGWFVMVVGNPGNASYEWVVMQNGKISHSDCGYGDSDIALRDGLIHMHGLPKTACTVKEVEHAV